MTPSKVLLSCLAIFAAIIAYDVYLYSDGVAGNSITQSVIYYSDIYPILPWVIGFLMGYLVSHFWDPKPQAKVISEAEQRYRQAIIESHRLSLQQSQSRE